MKKIVSSTFIIIMILGLLINTFALSVNRPREGETLPQKDINIKQKWNGDFEELTYVITDKGATSGIRYRTNEITFELNGMKGTLKATELTNYKPAPGEKVTSIVSIDINDLVKIFGEKNKEKVEEALKNPENLKIGANIEIYDAKNPKNPLVTITDEDYKNNTIYDKIKDYGFNLGHVEDMESRWHGHEQETPPPPPPTYEYIPDPEPTPPKKYGLRPGFWAPAENSGFSDTFEEEEEEVDYNGYSEGFVDGY